MAKRTWVGLTVVLVGALTGRSADLPPLPDKEGFAGSFAGVSNGSLVVAGGANFPDQKPWAGGKKVWHDGVFVLGQPGGKWQAAGRLPRPLGYGVSVTYNNGVVCAGGGDAVRHSAEVFRLEWKDGRLVTTELPPLPKPLANACGAIVGQTLYVAGGQEKPDVLKTESAVYCIDLARTDARWQTVDPCPGGGRMLAVAAGFDGEFFLAGGVDLVNGSDGRAARRYLRDVFRYAAGKGWNRVADLPRAVTAAPSPAPADASGFYILGGDDGTQVDTAPDRHRGFSASALRYDPKADRWLDAGVLASPRVTVPCVAWDKRWVIPGGEVRPGVRTPSMAEFTPAK